MDTHSAVLDSANPPSPSKEHTLVHHNYSAPSRRPPVPRRAALRAVQDVPPSTAPSYPSIGEVEEFAASLPERFLHCRELGHNWRPYTAGRYEDGGFERVLRCSRCRTRRVQTITSRGMILSNTYIHPDGYLSHGLGRIVGEGRGVLRLEAITRIVAKAEAED